MLIFLAAIREEPDPFANVLIQTTEGSVYNTNEYEWKLGAENRDHNHYMAKRKKAICEFYSSNEQKNEINHSDPLFLAQKASVSKDDQTSTGK